MSEFPVPFNDRVISYSTVGGETTFDFDFPVFVNTDIKVYRTVAGTTTLQTITTNYTVSINTDQEADPGGTITLVSITVAASETWTIAGAVTVERTNDFAQRGAWTAESINEEFDKIYMILQEMKRVMLAFEPAMSTTIGEIDKDGVTTGYFLRRTASGYDHAQVVSAGSISTPVAIGEGGTGQITAPLAFAALKQAATDTVTGVLEIATDAEALAATATDKALVPSNLEALSDVYTPTLTNVTNVAASTAYQAKYIRIGSIVFVSGRVDIDPTASGANTELGISLPIASNFAALQNCSGTASAVSSIQEAGGIYADSTNDRASLQFFSATTANHGMSYHFMYQVI